MGESLNIEIHSKADDEWSKEIDNNYKGTRFPNSQMICWSVAVRSVLCEVYVAKCTWVCGSFFLE